MDELFLVGRIARAHGNRGQVIVNPETDFAKERFSVGTVLLVGSADRPKARTIRDVRFHQGRPILELEGVDTIDAAEALAGTDLWVPVASLAPLPDGVYRHDDLVGCDVRDTNGMLIGRVEAVEGPMEHSRLVVQGEHGEVLIPLAEGICVSIDPDARRIVVDPPAGLIELNQPER